jgi:hypothetical protein
VNKAIEEAANGHLKGIMGYNKEPLVSIDFNHDRRSSIFDGSQTQVVGGNLVRIVAWYDNEWGFSNRMPDTASADGQPLVWGIATMTGGRGQPRPYFFRKTGQASGAWCDRR